MLTVTEEYGTYYPQEGRGHVRLKVQHAQGRARAAPRCRPHPHRNRARDKLKNRTQGPARGFCHTPAPGDEPGRSNTGTGRRKRKAARTNQKP